MRSCWTVEQAASNSGEFHSKGSNKIWTVINQGNFSSELLLWTKLPLVSLQILWFFITTYLLFLAFLCSTGDIESVEYGVGCMCLVGVVSRLNKQMKPKQKRLLCIDVQRSSLLFSGNPAKPHGISATSAQRSTKFTIVFPATVASRYLWETQTWYVKTTSILYNGIPSKVSASSLQKHEHSI